MRERRVGKLMALASKHLATSPTRPHTRYYASRHLHSGRGAGCRNSSRLQLAGELFLLTSFFIEPDVRSLQESLRKLAPHGVHGVPVRVRPGGARRESVSFPRVLAISSKSIPP